MSQSIPEDTPQKQCGRCKQFLPLSDYCADRSKKDGLHTICRACKKIPNPKPPRMPVPEGHKCCTKCRQVKPATTEFFYATPAYESTDCLVRQCKTCQNVYYRSRREHQAAYVRAYRSRHKERELEYARRYRNEHRERMKAWYKLYQQRPDIKARMNAYYHRRRSRKLGNGGTYTAEDVQRLYKTQRGRCYYCGVEFHRGKFAYHVDHIVPLSRGGSNDKDNIVLACPFCNTSKGSKLLHEWIDGGRLL